MYLTKYVEKYGKYSFEEKPFNNVDAVILATAVYSNFEVVAPSIYDPVTKANTFNDISRFDISVVVAGKTLVLSNKIMIPKMIKSKRFGNIVIKYICKRFDALSANQFFGCTFEIPGVGHYIALRGTDISVAGWKENLDIAINDKVKSQEDALEYVEHVAKLTQGPLFIGGHSKGGNLTLFSAINCSDAVKTRIINVYSFDGNGLATKDYYSSEEYLKIKHKIIFIRPFNSFVGELMYNPKDFLVVKSNAFGIFQHNSYSWKINKETGDFCYAKSNSKNALIRHWAFKEWFKCVDYDDRTLLIDFIICMLGGTQSVIFDFLFSFNKLSRYFKTKNKFTKEQRNRMRKALKSFSSCYRQAKLRYIIDGKKKQGLEE